MPSVPYPSKATTERTVCTSAAAAITSSAVTACNFAGQSWMSCTVSQGAVSSVQRRYAAPPFAPSGSPVMTMRRLEDI